METQTKVKTIHYKRAVTLNNATELQALVKQSLASPAASKADQRREFISQDGENCRLINRFTEYNGMLFGQLIFFEPGKSQTLVTLDESAEFYEINAITTDSIAVDVGTTNKRKEFINSILYFGLFANHVVLLQSSSLKARDLEAHLSWLLGTCTQVMDSNSALILQDKPSEATISKIEKAPVKSIVLGAPVQSVDNAVVEAVESEVDIRAKQIKFVPKGLGADVIRAALGENWFKSLKLEDSLDEANIQVSLEISYFRKTTKSGQQVLDNIATTLRHTEAADVKILLQGGGLISGNDLKLNGPISVKTINGIVDESDLYHQMHAWVLAKVNSHELEILK